MDNIRVEQIVELMMENYELKRLYKNLRRYNENLKAIINEMKIPEPSPEPLPLNLDEIFN